MRVLSFFLALSLLPVAASAEPLTHLGTYTPSLFVQANEGGKKAVLVHIVSKFCRTCETQRAGLLSATDLLPLASRHVVALDIPLETWQDSAMLRQIGTDEAGTFALVKNGEVLGLSTESDPMLLMDFLSKAMPVLPPVDPLTGLPLAPGSIDPATGLPVEATGVTAPVADASSTETIDPAMGLPVDSMAQDPMASAPGEPAGVNP